MNGIQLTTIIDQVLRERNITRGEFCQAIGITSSAYSAWRNGATPKKERIEKIEEYLDIDLSSMKKSEDMDEIRSILQNREDLRILLRSAKDVPVSSIYSLISQLEKMKEDENQS